MAETASSGVEDGISLKNKKIKKYNKNNGLMIWNLPVLPIAAVNRWKGVYTISY
jgi:hypothetical protein